MAVVAPDLVAVVVVLVVWLEVGSLKLAATAIYHSSKRRSWHIIGAKATSISLATGSAMSL